MSITMTMTASDALFALAAIQEAGAKAVSTRNRLIAIGASEADIAATTAAIYDRLERQLTTLLYPTCSWIEECDMPVAGHVGPRPFCNFHLAIVEGKAQVMTA